MASGALVLPMLETLGEHDQELVDRYEEADQGATGSVDRKIREWTAETSLT